MVVSLEAFFGEHDGEYDLFMAVVAAWAENREENPGGVVGPGRCFEGGGGVGVRNDEQFVLCVSLLVYQSICHSICQSISVRISVEKM